MSVLPESECLTQDERDFRLKGKTSAGKCWNQNYAQEVAEYDTAVDASDAGWAASKAADVRKQYNGMQRKLQNLAKSTERQRVVGLN